MPMKSKDNTRVSGISNEIPILFNQDDSRDDYERIPQLVQAPSDAFSAHRVGEYNGNVNSATPFQQNLSDMIFGGESDLPMVASFIPGADMVSKAINNEQVGLLDIPMLSDLKPLAAMVPIVKTLSDIKKGGRLGKNVRNLDKAKNPTVTMYHRTKREYLPSIMQDGLKTNVEHYGERTGGSDRLPPMVWLSPRNDEIPALRHEMDINPEGVSLLEITMPKKEFLGHTRYMFPNGRSGASYSGGTVELGPNDKQLGVSREGSHYRMLGINKVEPNYIKEVPLVMESVEQRRAKDFRALPRIDMITHIPTSEKAHAVYGAYGNDKRPEIRDFISKYEKLPRAARSELDMLDRKDYHYDYLTNKITPMSNLMQDINQRYTINERRGFDRPFNWDDFEYYISRGKSPLIASKLAKGEYKLYTKPFNVPNYSARSANFNEGSISRGIDTQMLPIRKRSGLPDIDWDAYNMAIADGRTPKEALYCSTMYTRRIPFDDAHNWDKAKVYDLGKKIKSSDGSISRGMKLAPHNEYVEAYKVKNADYNDLINLLPLSLNNMYGLYDGVLRVGDDAYGYFSPKKLGESLSHKGRDKTNVLARSDKLLDYMDRVGIKRLHDINAKPTDGQTIDNLIEFTNNMVKGNGIGNMVRSNAFMGGNSGDPLSNKQQIYLGRLADKYMKKKNKGLIK